MISGNKRVSFLYFLEFSRQDLNCLKFFFDFDFASRPFHSFAPLKEKNFWPDVVRRNGTHRSVSVLRSSRVLASDIYICH